jgi:hypothetical protein
MMFLRCRKGGGSRPALTKRPEMLPFLSGSADTSLYTRPHIDNLLRFASPYPIGDGGAATPTRSTPRTAATLDASRLESEGPEVG